MILNWDDITFANPEVLWAGLIVPLLWIFYAFRGNKRAPILQVSNLRAIMSYGPGWRTYIRHLLPLLRGLALIAGIVALARPQIVSTKEKITTDGIDIVLSLDVSSSMLAQDFRPNRLEAAKETARDFVESRKNDRMGLVIFAGESFTQCPLTTDHTTLKDLLSKVSDGLIKDGTAIGMGLATAVERLKESPAKSKVVILLTDGVNNSGFVDPVTATDIAQAYDVKVYTIGVGSMGTAPYPVQTPFGMRTQQMEVEIDEDLLEEVASATGGKYYRATDEEALRNIYAEIDELEKTKIEVSTFKRYKERFWPLLWLALAFSGLEILLRFTWFKMLV